MVQLTIDVPEDLYDKLQVLREHSHGAVDTMLVTALREAIEQEESGAKQRLSREERRQQLQTALGDLVEPFDVDQFPVHLRPRIDRVDHEDLRARMPDLDPPLSATVADEREDRL